MAETVNVYEFKRRFSQLLARAADGDEIIIARAGRPQARLVPLAGGIRKREPGAWEGRVWIGEDFDAPAAGG